MKITKEFELVYQGGHHDIYCNKKKHIQVAGGFCHPKIDRDNIEQTYPTYKCNCSYFISGISLVNREVFLDE